jgi:hypothetical protein
MEKLDKITLGKMQEIQNINIEPADNGGCVLRYTVYKPAAKHSDSSYDNHTELFDDDEVGFALDRIRDLYKANLEARKTGKAEVMPMAKEG